MFVMRVCRICRNLDKYPEAATTPGVLVVRLDAPLFFANTAHFEGAIKRRIEESEAEAHDAGCEYHQPVILIWRWQHMHHWVAVIPCLRLEHILLQSCVGVPCICAA